MSATTLYTDAHLFRKARTANTTTAAFAVVADTLTTPTEGSGYIDLMAGRVGVPNTVLLKPYGVGSDTNTGSLRVYGIRQITASGSTIQQWTPVMLFEGTFTLTTLTGVAAGLVLDTERYADTVTRTTGIENVADQIFSPTADEPAHFLIDAKGHRWLYVELIVGTATSVNCLWAGV